MKIWELKVDYGKKEKYDDFQLINRELDNERYFNKKINNGQKLMSSNIKIKDGWKDVYIESIDKGRKESDCIELWDTAGYPVFSKKAVDVLAKHLDEKVEVLPLIHKDAEYYLIRTLNYIDAIDHSKAEFEKLEDGFVFGFEKYAFLSEKIKNQHIFKIYLKDKLFSTSTFVSDEFRQTVIDNKLEGFKFDLVWELEKEKRNKVIPFER